MKIKEIVIFLLITVSFYARSQENKSTKKLVEPTIGYQYNDKVIKELNKFYSLYFSAMENVDNTSENDLDLIKRKYMTSKLYEKLKKIDMDYDPVINAQDVDSNWQKSININHVKDDLFKMCIKNSYDKSLNCTYLKVEENFKIYDIQVNNIASILNYINEDETYIDTQNNIIDKDSVNSKIIAGNYQYGKCSESKPSFYFVDDEGQFNFYTPKISGYLFL
ncbi:hypothetical protein SAMN05421664_0863 [Chryseobacterium soldanellicola]|uniref:DUF3828 domain-containing protein n=1 Tax=Chryseobacterium soldanellicola TaxID=311333 RepID=A0A1H0YPM4_9FLAO|nr:hypothetical protein [Chryseobacterium soldanellicola]SDQ17099.1 hypothetical protein SAMN05421664_0863 [Chryseobacterium soldanellicola]